MPPLLTNNLRITRICLPLILCLCLLHQFPAKSADRGDEIIRQVQARFETVSTVSARFNLRYTSTGAEEVYNEEGRLYLEDHNRFRTETDQQIIVSDGKTIWVYNRAENQVIIRNFEDGIEDFLTPQQLLYEYPQRYGVVSVQEGEYSGMVCDILMMEPIDETDPTRILQVWVDRENRFTRKFVLEDMADNITVFEFEEFQWGEKLSDKTFHFLPPEGSEVIDVR